MKPLLFSVLCALSACDTSGPFGNGFQVTSLAFTGNPAAYCEFSLKWEPAGSVYTVFRSTEPGIAEDPSEASVLCTVSDTLWVDGQGLAWGTVYYWAVNADGNLWSNEVSLAAPPSPSPCTLSVQKTGFSSCSLSWTGAQESFGSYAVLRSRYPGISSRPRFADTVFVSTDIDTTFCMDHSSPPEVSSYYAVAVTDTAGFSGFSNEAEFVPGGEVPWIARHQRVVYGQSARNFLVTANGQQITGGRYYSGYSLGGVFSTSDGAVELTAPVDPGLIAVLENGEILASHLTGQGWRLSLFSQDFSTETVSRDFPPVHGLVELESGILLGSSSTSCLVAGNTLQTLKSLDFGFFQGFLSEDLNTVFLLNRSGVLLLDASGIYITGSITGSYSSIALGVDGRLRCTSSRDVVVYDSASLVLEHRFDFPEQAAVSEACVLPPWCDMVYVPVWENDELVFTVWNIFTGETPGTVRPQDADFTHFQDLMPSPSGDFLWCLGTASDGTMYMFRISLL